MLLLVRKQFKIDQKQRFGLHSNIFVNNFVMMYLFSPSVNVVLIPQVGANLV